MLKYHGALNSYNIYVHEIFDIFSSLQLFSKNCFLKNALITLCNRYDVFSRADLGSYRGGVGFLKKFSKILTFFLGQPK